MDLVALRLLPPLAIGRLGSADTPVDAYTLEVDDEHPLDFRRVAGARTLDIDEDTGCVSATRVPTEVRFTDAGRLRPVAPFLEVWAVTAAGDLVPLTMHDLATLGITPADVQWEVEVANRKVQRRTGDAGDAVEARATVHGHRRVPLLGTSPHFVDGAVLPLGDVRYVCPSREHPEIRLRFTPAKGYIYGPAGVHDPAVVPERRIYRGGWAGWQIPVDPDTGDEIVFDDDEPQDTAHFRNETFPPSLFAIERGQAPPWLHGNLAVSRGYLDDACDGIVTVRLTLPDGRSLSAQARITAGPPTVVPDALFVRSLADDLEQVIHGPAVAPDEPVEVTRRRAEDIVRRAFETARFLNLSVMNGDPVLGRDPLSLDTMPAEEAFDTERLMRPVMAAGSVDTLSVMALHQQVFAALRGGVAPWFARLLRRPEEVGDFTDQGRRKMPALMCGADGSYLALTRRQISTIARAAVAPPAIETPSGTVGADAPARMTPRNLTAQVHHRATGNPFSSTPAAAIANCCPGLEVDFRAVWRRMFVGLTLREWDNLILEADPVVAEAFGGSLEGHRLLRVDGHDMAVRMVGPSPADPAAGVYLATEDNPHALAPMEWSNAFAKVLLHRQGGTVDVDVTAEPVWEEQQLYAKESARTLTLRVREFFEPGTAFISRELAEPGELTQGLCSPWQNDFRECSCYYWASARPDFVNVEPSPSGGSRGDNWLQKERTGEYVPDDYVDTRLVLYDDLLDPEWERWLRVQLRGRDAEPT